MPTWTLAEIEAAVRRCWSLETCDELDRATWSAANPSRGQCVATAFLLHDLIGGSLVLGEVRGRDGSPRGWHYWNRLPGGIDVDLTRGQFSDDEILAPGVVVDRPGEPFVPGGEHYALMRRRLLEELVSGTGRRSAGTS